MTNNTVDINNIPREKFEFVHDGERIMDKKFDDKPISYFRDAWGRFRKNKASVVATVIIIAIFAFAFIYPICVSRYDSTFLDTYYQKKGARSSFLSNFGIADGTVERSFSEKTLIKALALGIAAEDWDGRGVKLDEALQSDYQPMLYGYGEPTYQLDLSKKEVAYYNAKIDVYLEVGFVYKSIEQDELAKIQAWEEETGLHILYPLIENNDYNFDSADPNCWYKTNKKGNPVKVNEATEKVSVITMEDLENGATLQDNYKRDAEGNLKYYEYTGGGTFETAQYRIRVLYYNYYIYQNGFEPEYLFGTDSQGYDLALRMADGIKLSLLIAVCVSVVNFILGAAYGAIEGYYGGIIDITLERVSDILSGIPFIIVATLFQIHLVQSGKVGPVTALLFAYILTGWIGTASNVRTQFYRFKNQEYVMAARTLGASDKRIIWKHIFPNTLGTIITSSALAIPGVINSESMLSYLGIVKLGTAETTSLGTLLSDANSIWTNYPHLLFYPAIVLSLLMICFNLFGNGLRDAFNPSLRGVEE